MTYKEYFESLSEEEQESAISDREFSVRLQNIKGCLIIPFYYGIDNDERFPNIHELKILPEFIAAVTDDCKRFELCKDDRDYQVDDILAFEEWDGEKFTGNFAQRRIRYILRNCPEYGLKPGFCILGF